MTDTGPTHDRKVRHDLAMLNINAPSWVPPRSGPSGETVFDAVIVGGGQSGLAAAFGLKREQVSNILILDDNPEGQEGPWVTYARMVTLRTPKHLTGPDLGVPSLTFRAWWEGRYGVDSWDALDKIPRHQWMRYLRWLRTVLDLPVRNEVRVERIEPSPAHGHYRLHVSGNGASAGGDVILARKVILATGIQGGGDWHVPTFIRDTLDRSRYAHTADPIDYPTLAGKRIGILGGGASAFDNAQYALDQGVAEAHVFLRRRDLPRINPIRYMEAAGFMRHFADLDDGEKYRGMTHFLAHSQPPTNDTFERAKAYDGFRLHLGAPWQQVEQTPTGARVTTPQGSEDFDFLVISTGLVTDIALRPELAAIADDIALWDDRYTPPPGEECPLIDQHPYLGPDFALTPRTPDGAERLYGLFFFNYGALASMGLSAAALSGMKFALPRLIHGVTRQLFMDDRETLLGGFYAYAEEEFTGQAVVA